MADAEYEAVSKFVRADRRFRMFLYVVVSLCFLAFIFILYEVHTSNEKTQREITSKIDESLNHNRIQNEETRQYVTCLLLVPIQERSEQVQRSCFDKVDQPGGLQSADFQPTSVDAAGVEDQAAFVPSQSSYTGESGDSYTDNTATQNTAQRNTSQEHESANVQDDDQDYIEQVLRPITDQIGVDIWQNN